MVEDSYDAFASSPQTVIDLPKLFPNHRRQSEKAKKETTPVDSNVTSLISLVAALPEALETRKKKNIYPGAPNDPVSELF
eukprot:scaffold8658_cov101-Cylindrotheca_fusiformis.AAC.1